MEDYLLNQNYSLINNHWAEDNIINGKCSIQQGKEVYDNISSNKDFSFSDILSRFFLLKYNQINTNNQLHSTENSDNITNFSNNSLVTTVNNLSNKPEINNNFNIKNNNIYSNYQAKVIEESFIKNDKLITKGKFILAHKNNINRNELDLQKEEKTKDISYKKTIIIVITLFIIGIFSYDLYGIYKKYHIDNSIELNHCYKLFNKNNCNNLPSDAPTILKEDCLNLRLCISNNTFSFSTLLRIIYKNTFVKMLNTMTNSITSIFTFNYQRQTTSSYTGESKTDENQYFDYDVHRSMSDSIMNTLTKILTYICGVIFVIIIVKLFVC